MTMKLNQKLNQMKLNHLTLGYSLQTDYATRSRTITLDLDSLAGLGAAVNQYARFFMDIDMMLQEAEEHVGPCRVCEGKHWIYAGGTHEEPEREQCPACEP